MLTKIVVYSIGHGYYAKTLQDGQPEPANVLIRVEGKSDTPAQLQELKKHLMTEVRKRGIKPDELIGLDE